MLNVLIPMAGAGQRFVDAGYQVPKPLINVGGIPMIRRVVANINIPNAHYIFLVRDDHLYQYPTMIKCLTSSTDCKVTILTVDKVTKGAACTALLAKDFINNDFPLLIANCDQIQDWFSLDFLNFVANSPMDGCIVTFDSTSENNSYVQLDDTGNVIKAREKEVISTHATTGMYYWSKGSSYVTAAERMINKDIRTNNEFYICPVYNENVYAGQSIKTFPIAKHWPIGTPEELEVYKKERLGI